MKEEIEFFKKYKEVLVETVASDKLNMFFYSSLLLLQKCQEEESWSNLRQQIIICETLNERISFSKKLIRIRVIDKRYIEGFETQTHETASFDAVDFSKLFNRIIPDLIEKINLYKQEGDQKWHTKKMDELQAIYKLYFFYNQCLENNVSLENLLVIFEIPTSFGQWR